MSLTRLYIFSVLISSLFISSVNATTLSIHVDNDGLLLMDKDYSSGLSIRLSDKINNFGYSIEIGGQIWTPTDIRYSTPRKGERPYAGLLFLKSRTNYQTDIFAIKANIMFGTVGPRSLADESQNLVHDIIGSVPADGWKYQIYNKVVYQFGLEGHSIISQPNNFDELSLMTRGQIGNFRDELAIGLTYRIGTDLASSFGSVSLIGLNNIDAGMLEASSRGSFFYLSTEALYRFTDLTIEGSKPIENDNVEIKHLQSAFGIGAVIYNQQWGGNLSLTWQSKQFKSSRAFSHGFANFTIFHRF